MNILSPTELRSVEQLRLNPRKALRGSVRGERLTSRKGISIEFADYRGYAHGDDLRHLDWNVLARLQTPVVRTYRDEQDLAVYLMLDCSASMSFGEPTKFETARQALAALAVPALASQDAIRVCALGKRQPPSRVLRGMGAFSKLSAELTRCEPTGETDLYTSLRELAGALPRAGVVIIASDGLDPRLSDAVRFFGARGHEVWLVQVLSDEELDPDMEGDLKLIDSERGTHVEVTASAQVLETYKRNLSKHCEKLSTECKRIGGRYALHKTSEPLLALIKTLKSQGWLIT